MNGWEMFATIAVSVLGAGGPIALWVSTRSVNRAAGTGDQIHRRLGNIETFIQSLVDNGTNNTKRINNLEVQIYSIDERVRSNDHRLKALETVNEIFHHKKD